MVNPATVRMYVYVIQNYAWIRYVCSIGRPIESGAQVWGAFEFPSIPLNPENQLLGSTLF